VDFVGEVPRDQLRELMRNARAFVFAAEEDFGIVPLEAQACGTPVIAYARGGVLETIAGDGAAATGRFFDVQSADAIAAAVEAFESHDPIDPQACRRSAERFGSARFRDEFIQFVGAITPAPAAGNAAA
jgi:glycosyltransferase involved in cell wall biosynthesis